MDTSGIEPAAPPLPIRYGAGRDGACSVGGCTCSTPRRQNPPVCASVLVYVRWGRTAHTPTLVLGAAGRDLLRFVGQLLCVGSSERATVTRLVYSSCVVLTGRTSPCYWYFMEAPNFLSPTTQPFVVVVEGLRVVVVVVLYDVLYFVGKRLQPSSGRRPFQKKEE